MRFRRLFQLCVLLTLVCCGSATVHADPKDGEKEKDRERKEEKRDDAKGERRSDDGKELSKDRAELERELDKLAAERDRELQKAADEAERENKPEKFQEKQREILNKYHEKQNHVIGKYEEKHGSKVIIEPRGPAGRHGPGDDRARPGPKDVPADGREPGKRHLSGELRDVEAAMADEKRRHETRIAELRAARKGADDAETKRIENLIARQRATHQKKMAALEQQHKELSNDLKASGQGAAPSKEGRPGRERPVTAAPPPADAPTHKPAAEGTSRVDQLEQEIAAEEAARKPE